MRTGRARTGFSLTEILMAVGILGIGMTMVASVFPVAVDQSRRSTELTMAALSARSVGAVLRARRQKATVSLRTKTMLAPEGGGTAPQTAKIGTTVLPYELSSYNPANFLYGDSQLEPGGTGGAETPKRRRQYTNSPLGMYGMWSMGAYVPVVFATPMSDNPSDAGHGPWRVAILIYKSRGQPPAYLSAPATPSASWVWKQQSGTEVGTYIMDWRFAASSNQATPNTRGEVYKVQRHIAMPAYDVVVPAVAFRDARPGSMQFCAYLAGGDQSTGTLCYGATNSIPSEWVALPGAVAAYHTILGD